MIEDVAPEQHTQALIADEQIDAAITALIELCRSSGVDARNEAIAHAASWRSLASDQRKGTLNSDTFRAIKAQLAHRSLALMDVFERMPIQSARECEHATDG